MPELTITVNTFAERGAEEGTKGAIVATMVQLRANAVPLVPVDIGPLVNSMMWRKGWDTDIFNLPREGGFNEGGGAERAVTKIEPTRGLEGVVGTAQEYGVYQEFGTRFMPAQPSLRPAADAIRGATAAEIANKWGNDAMYRAFLQRKTRRTTR